MLHSHVTSARPLCWSRIPKMSLKHWFLASAIAVHGAAQAVSPVRVEHVRAIELPAHAVALSAASRTELREWIESLRGNRGLCRFEVAVVMGWASRDEGDARRRSQLAKMRAEYVAHQLMGSSLPLSNTFVSEGDLQISGPSPPNRGVTVYVLGSPAMDGCTSFREYTADTAAQVRARRAAVAQQPRDIKPGSRN